MYIHTFPFIGSLNTARLSHRKSALSGITRGTCRAQKHDKGTPVAHKVSEIFQFYTVLLLIRVRL